jgi:hypothetical protein
LKNGDRLRINGLGILEVKSRPARMGRNPATARARVAVARKLAVILHRMWADSSEFRWGKQPVVRTAAA